MNAVSARGRTRAHDTHSSLVSVRIVRGLAEAVEAAGGSKAAFLAASGVEPGQLDSADACLARSELYRIFELAMRTADDTALGLHWCERLSDSVFNPITQLIRHAATLRRGLDTMIRFRGLISEPPSYELVETKDKVTDQ